MQHGNDASPIHIPNDPDVLFAALAELDADELQALDDMTDLPELWPRQYRATLPTLRTVIDDFRALSAGEIARRIGAHL